MDFTTTDKRIRRTHRLLREAFIEVVAEKGYEGTRVEDIIVQADIGRTTFYTHFKDKRHLLQHVADTFETRYKRDLSRIVSDPQGLSSFDVVESMFASFQKNETFFRLALESPDVPLFQDLVRKGMKEIILGLFQRQVKQSQTLPEIPLELIVENSVGGVLALAQWWLAEGVNRCSSAEMARIFDRLDLNGRAELMGLPTQEPEQT